MVHELLMALDRHAKTLGYKYNLPFDLYFTTMIYLDKKGELTNEDVEHVFSNEEMRSVFSRLTHLPTIISVVTLIKKYNESVSNVLMTKMGFYISSANLLKWFIDIVDLLKFDLPNDFFFNKWNSGYLGLLEDQITDQYATVNLAQDILVRGNYEMYEFVKTRYVYTKDDIVYAVYSTAYYSTAGKQNCFNTFVADQAITGDEMICYSATGQKISVYEKIVELVGAEKAKTHFGYLAPRPTYPIIKMIPDVGRVTLLDKTHATVQSLTETGLIEKQMTYTITDGKIRLSTDLVEVNW